MAALEPHVFLKYLYDYVASNDGADNIIDLIRHHYARVGNYSSIDEVLRTMDLTKLPPYAQIEILALSKPHLKKLQLYDDARRRITNYLAKISPHTIRWLKDV